MNRWETYDLYNRAVAQVFFTEEAGGEPVYLDLDDDAVSRLAAQVKVPAECVCESLAGALRGVLSLQGAHGSPFTETLHQLTRWMRKWRQTPRDRRIDLEPPPVLAMLAVFSMAAERMGRDATMAPHNYFGRLAQILEIEDEQHKRRVETHYRRHVELFWNVLSTWLTGLDGMLGLPSAEALSHRYIGLSISQALVREHDRGKLPRFFAAYGFHPGQEVTPYEVEPLLHEWMRRDPPPISKALVGIWTRQRAARERIASVVSLELRSWDGAGLGEAPLSPQAGGSRGEVRLVALTRSGLFGRRVEFSIVARFPGPAGPQRMRVVSAVGDDKPVLDFMPGANTWHRLPRPADFENASILDGVLVLADADGATIQRRPRRVLPMRKDESLGLFLEAERLQLAEDGLVFAVASLANDVEGMLTQVARPGFTRVDGGSEGVPDGWTLFRDVQVLGVPPAEARALVHPDLNVLLPSVTSQMAFAEGLKLPGRMRKFSVSALPEIRAVAAGAEHLELNVVRKNAEGLDAVDELNSAATEELVCKGEADSAAMVVPLGALRLPVGDYEALLFIDYAKDPAQRLSFFLRSGDSVDLAMWARSPALAHQPALHRGRAGLSADDRDGDSVPVIVGAVTYGDASEPARTAAPRIPWWTERAPAAGANLPTTLTTLDPTSCLVTGAHYWELPYATTSSVEGCCRKCGLVKRFPNTHRRSRAGKQALKGEESSYRLDVHAVAPVQPSSLTWDMGLDALMHLGGGPYSALERVALQIEGSLLFVDKFARTLEALGHVEIKRDERTLEPFAWEIAPTALAELSDGAYLLTGYWPASLVARLDESTRATPVTLRVETSVDGPSRVTVSSLTPEDAHELAGDIGEVTVADDAARAMLRATPNLSSAEESLPTVGMPGSRKVSRFHLGSAAWVPQHHAETPGAYRLDSFGSTYIMRGEEDVAEGTAKIGTAQLVKHLEALHAGRPMLAYDEQTQCLIVPLGADLPGLYGRAAALCSGRPPEPVVKKRLLRYPGVPAEVADAIAARLAH